MSVTDSTRRIIDGEFWRLPADFEPPMWDPVNDPNFKVDEVVTVLGPRRSGKSTLTIEVMLKRRHLYPIVYCFSNTAHNGAWQQVLPADKVIQGVDLELIKQIIDLNIVRKQAYCQKKKGNPMVPVILEDPMNSVWTVRAAKEISTIIYNGRHHCVPLWTLSQHYTIFKPGERGSVDRYILFKYGERGMRKLIEQTWGRRVLEIYDDVTSEPSTALVIDNKSDTPIEKKLFKYKADYDWLTKALHKNLRLGNRAMWDGIDIKQQKKEWPTLELPSLSTLAGKFNEPVDDADVAEVIHEEPVTFNLSLLGGESSLKRTNEKEEEKEDKKKEPTTASIFTFEPL